jgi:hypothetical protein
MTKSLTVTEHTLMFLASKPEVVKEVPALRALLRTEKEKSCCSRGSKHRQTVAQVRSRLLSIPGPQKALLKRTLGVDELIINLPTPSGGRRAVL